MEPRAHHIIIGLFTLLVAAGLMLFALWLGKSSLDKNYDSYLVIFNEAVTGLSNGSPVQFNGIKVGEVVQLHLDHDDPSKVLATIRVDASTPVRQNTLAKLSMAGVTGTSFIQLSSTPGESPPLIGKKGQLPQIIASPSSISRLMTDGNEIFSKITELLNNANQIFSKQNTEYFGNTLKSIEQTSTSIAASRQDLYKAFADFPRISEQTIELLANSNRLIKEHGASAMRDLQQSMAALQRSSATLESLLNQNKNSLNQGLQSFGNLQPALQDLRETLSNLRNITQNVEENPAGYLLGREQAKEFQP